MKVPAYWAKSSIDGRDREGRSVTYSAWGWSTESKNHAESEARSRAQRICDRLRTGEKPDSYDYHEHPLREQIVDSFLDGETQLAVITRNRYGALVLNCANVCFVDVDFPTIKSAGFLDSILFAFSARKKHERLQAYANESMQKVKQWSGNNPQHSFRLYRTKAGLRLLFTDRTYDPRSDEITAIMNGLGSDPLYQKLTTKQNCFRARLTPKPWRCGCSSPPNRYPWEYEKEAMKYEKWLEKYEQTIHDYVSCKFVRSIGNPSSHDCIAKVVELHDRYSCSDGDHKLA